MMHFEPTVKFEENMLDKSATEEILDLFGQD